MKRGLVFAKYDTMAATTRQRFAQAIPYLYETGIEIDICPLFNNAYLEQLFTHGKRSRWKIILAYAARSVSLLRCRNYDFLWVQYEMFPYLPGSLELLIRLAGKPIIYDIDDALFHQYDQHPNALLRRLLGRKLQPLLRSCDLAFCGNAYLLAYVSPFCPRSEIIPTTVDTDIYFPVEKPPVQTPVLGWIGSPSTWNYCLPLADIFSAFVRTGQLDMLVIGAGHAASAQHPFTFRDWVEEREVEDVQQMNIGIMPIPDAPWARGKCGYKLIQYMACGVPVIASPVGVNCEIVEHGVNGFLASTPQEWRAAIERLLGDAALRQRMGQAGRTRVEQRYSIQQIGPRMAQLISGIVGQPALKHENIP